MSSRDRASALAIEGRGFIPRIVARTGASARQGRDLKAGHRDVWLRGHRARMPQPAGCDIVVPPCSRATTAASCAPRTKGRTSRWPAGSTAGATTAASSSSTCATTTASPRWCSTRRRAARPTPSPIRSAASTCSRWRARWPTGPRARRTRTCRRARSRSRPHAATVLNAAKTPPFYIVEETDVDELLRLKYRYLDLRRETIHRNIVLRARVTKFIRDFLTERGFTEIETPILDRPHAGGRPRLPRPQPRPRRATSTRCRSRRSR